MGKVNVCLKRSYIVVTSLIAILSALLLAVTLFGHGHIHDDEEKAKLIIGIHAMYIISIINLLLAIMGVYGSCKEKQWALIVFAVGMILSSLLLIGMEIRALLARSQVAKEMKMQYLYMLPLANASESFLDFLQNVQIELHCCGMDQGYLDWGYNISASCLCNEESTNPCVEAPRNSSLFELVVEKEPILIYKESCLPYLIMDEMNSINVSLGILLGIILLWVLSVVLSVVILCQLSLKEDTPAVVYSPEAKAGNYTPLADAAVYA